MHAKRFSPCATLRGSLSLASRDDESEGGAYNFRQAEMLAEGGPRRKKRSNHGPRGRNTERTGHCASHRRAAGGELRALGTHRIARVHLGPDYHGRGRPGICGDRGQGFRHDRGQEGGALGRYQRAGGAQGCARWRPGQGHGRGQGHGLRERRGRFCAAPRGRERRLGFVRRGVRRARQARARGRGRGIAAPQCGGRSGGDLRSRVSGIAAKLTGPAAAIGEAAWDTLANSTGLPMPYPFTRYAFIHALEVSGSACVRTGWEPVHLVLERDGRPLALLPLYRKSHSYGEYVFDQGWAEVFARAGGHYYPKLQASVPFTPVTGPRLLVASEDAVATGEALLRAVEAAVAEVG